MSQELYSTSYFKSERVHTILSILLSITTLVLSLVFIGLIFAFTLGWLLLLMPIYFSIFSLVKLHKSTTLLVKQYRLKNRIADTDSQFVMYQSWIKKIIGVTYFTIFHLVLWTIYISLMLPFIFTDILPAFNYSMQVMSVTFVFIFYLGIIVVGAINFLFLQHLIIKNEKTLKYREGFELESKLTLQQARKDYLSLISLIVGMITIVWGIYLIVKALIKN